MLTDQERKYNGFKKIIERIAENTSKYEKLCHREIRYLITALEASEVENILPDEVCLLATGLRMHGLSHKAKSYLARKILEILEEAEKEEEIKKCMEEIYGEAKEF